MTEEVQPVVSSIMIVGVLTRCTLFHSICDLKVAQIIVVQCCLIQKFMLYKFELDHNATEATSGRPKAMDFKAVL